MSLKAFQQASGLRIRAGEQGAVYQVQGKIVFLRAPSVGIDSHLWAAMKGTVDALRLTVVVSSIDTGKHAAHSRHHYGGAVDVVEVQPLGHAPVAATLANPHAVHLCDYLHAQGWKPYEQGPWPAVLLGPVRTPYNQTDAPHADHIHWSVFHPG